MCGNRSGLNIVCRTFVTIPFLVLLFSLLICGCTKNLCPNKTIFEQGYDDFTADIEEHYSDFDDADWKRLNVDFKQYVNHCYSKYKE